ncbi:MAG TPA: NUDIX domain-containing protein [Kofleriaceae bacterium]
MVLLPIVDDGREGLLVVRRNIPPQVGSLALVGGFIELSESWEDGVARELREEVNVHVDAEALVPFWFASSAPDPRNILVFATAPAMDARELPPFEVNSESQERGVVFGPGGEAGADDGLAFPLHVEAVRRYFGARGVGGPLGFVRR